MANIGIAEKVAEAIRGTVEEKGCTLWDTEYVKEGSRRVLRVTIDSDDGIDLDKCEEVHRAVEAVIDELDPIEESYYLECSSPGIERVLRKTEHFEYALGCKIDVRLFTAEDGKKDYCGILEACSDESITLDGKEIPIKKISHANMHYDFEN